MITNKHSRIYKRYIAEAKNSATESQALARFAEKVSSRNQSDQTKKELLMVIDDILMNGRDDILLAAIEDIKTKHGREFFEYQIIEASETLLLETDYKEPCEAKLFVIPVVFVVSPSEEFPVVIKDASICTLFRKHGLVSKYPTLFLHNEFLQLADIKQLPSRRQKIIGQILALNSEPADPSASIRVIAVKKKESHQDVDLILRFLIGVSMSAFCAPVFLPDEKSSEQYEASVKTWQKDLKNHLIKQTGISTMEIGHPESLSKAINQGVSLLQEQASRYF